MDAPIVVNELYEVAPGHEADFYSWGTALIQAVARVDGYLGGDVRDPEWVDGEWQIVHRWADRDLAREWDASTVRAKWLAAAASFARPRPARERPPLAPAPRGVASVAAASPASPAPAPAPAGPSSGPPTPPPKWKTAIVTLTAVFPPVLFFNVTLIPRLSGVSVVLRTFVLCVGVTGAVTWIMMPRLLPLFRGFLNPVKPQRRAGAVGGGIGGVDPEEPMSAPDEDDEATEVFPRFKPAAEPISNRSARRTQSDARTIVLAPTDPYPRRNR